MENLEINQENILNGIYGNRKVLITGHTGFKGSWMASFLQLLGARITGYALPPSTSPSHFSLLDLNIISVFNDINNYKKLSDLFSSFKPEIVFHLAAQPLVLESYRDPLNTFNTNIQGTVNLLECCRLTDSVKSIIVITTDKVYENDNRRSGYSEKDRLGGTIPTVPQKPPRKLYANRIGKPF